MTGSTPATAVVTGATRGIGRAIAERLVRLDFRVVGLARNPTGVEPFRVLPCDVSDARALMVTLADIGTVDVLINNAGSSMSGKIESTSLEDWHRLMQLNATSVFAGVKAVLPTMRARDSGRIVTIASTAGLEAGRYISAYAASKHAVLGLMRALSAEIADTGVAAATVCPTFVLSDMTRETIRNIAAKTGASVEEATSKLEAMTPCGRLLDPEEVADAVAALLALPAPSMNGEVIVLDGCQTETTPGGGSSATLDPR